MINYLKDLFQKFTYGTLRNDSVKCLFKYDFILVDGHTGSGKSFLAEKLQKESGNAFQIFEEHPIHQIDFYHIGQLLDRKTPCILVFRNKLNLNHLPYPVRNFLRSHPVKITLVSLVENRRYKYGPLYLPRQH